jgi:hypothetical protein
MVSDKVNWSQHIDSITNNANRTLGFLRRYLKISSLSIKEQAYNTLVRPLVEYASPVWDPHHQTDIRKDGIDVLAPVHFVGDGNPQVLG